MKKFCKDLIQHAMKIINYEEKEMILLTYKENKSYEKQNFCYICKKRFSTDNDNGIALNKKYHKVRDHCHSAGKFRGAAHSIFNLRYKTPKETPKVFHNDSTYDNHFITNKLAKEFDGQLESLGENTEKYVTFSVPISKKLDKGKTITYRLKFIDSFRFMSTSLSSLVDNLSVIYKKECKGCKERRNIKSVCNFLGLKNNKLNYECKEFKKWWWKPVNGLIKKFSNTHRFCNGNINKFVFLLRKGVYPYEYLGSWERFDETPLPDKKDFYSELYLGEITNEDYTHAQKISEELKLKNLGDYHDLYIQSDALLLADVHESFRKKCIETYKLDLAHFLSSPGLSA